MIAPTRGFGPHSSPGRGDTECFPLLEGSLLRRAAPLMLAVILTGLLALPAFADTPAPADKLTTEAPKEPPAPDKGDTAWMLMSTGLVMFMMPGLALFYGGIVRRK